MSDSLSLYQIETELAEVMRSREEYLHPEDIALCDAAIVSYVQGEIAKVDSIVGFLRNEKMLAQAANDEISRLRGVADAHKARHDRLKATCLSVMYMMGKRRLEGKFNVLAIKGNGGKQAVRVDTPDLVPNELCDWVGRVPGTLWWDILATVLIARARGLVSDELAEAVRLLDTMKRSPSLSAIAEAMAQPCPDCRVDSVGGGVPECQTCGGSGKQGVPGCSLEPRGEHLEVK